MSDPDHVFRDALALPAAQRAKLAAQLLDSLGPEPPEAADEAWIAQIERRAREAQAGIPGIPWKDTRACIRARLRPR